jgi:hypothetical protein
MSTSPSPSSPSPSSMSSIWSSSELFEAGSRQLGARLAGGNTVVIIVLITHCEALPWAGRGSPEMQWRNLGDGGCLNRRDF